MADDEVIPHVGINLGRTGMVRLGMSQAEARDVLGGDRTVRVDFRSDPPVVAFIEAAKHWGSFDGIDLFEDAADDVIAEIVRRNKLDSSVYRPGRHTYYFPDFNMVLWRSCVSEEDGDQGYIFDSVSLHAPGYYDSQTLAYLRGQSGLPPLPDTKS